MPKTEYRSFSELTLDPDNYRSVHQPDEAHALHSFITIDPTKFWGLVKSLLTDGYLPTENIIILSSGKELIVKEGNRRIAALKLLHGLLPDTGLDIPGDVRQKIRDATAAWKRANTKVPCAIYSQSEKEVVGRIVSMIHGKGEDAARAPWTSVARARENRDSGKPEHALELLEKYLVTGQNLTPLQRERWSGDYPLSVLQEVLPNLARRLAFSTTRELSQAYPTVDSRLELDSLLFGIGIEDFRFKNFRENLEPTLESYGLPKLALEEDQRAQKPSPTLPDPLASSSANPPAPSPARRHRSKATNDPASVKKLLRDFEPHGKKREKLVTLVQEARRLNLKKTPMCFCFALRSMLEISAKLYCEEHSIAMKDPGGKDKKLLTVLNEVIKDITTKHKHLTRQLHPAGTALNDPHGFLSITSLHQLIHGETFTLNDKQISTQFHNVFPLIICLNP